MYSLPNRTMIVHGCAIESNIGRIVEMPGDSSCRGSPTFLVHPILKSECHSLHMHSLQAYGLPLCWVMTHRNTNYGSSGTTIPVK